MTMALALHDTFPLESIEEHGNAEQRLDLSETKLYGRSKEVEILRSAHLRTCSGKSELVVVKGRSGSGKTKLVEEGLRRYVSEEQSGFFAIGKYDSMHNDPYSAIACALNDLIDLILDSEAFTEIQKRLNSTFGRSEMEELVRVIPDFARLFDVGRPQRLKNEAINMAKAGTRFKILCRSFVKALVTPEFPVTLVLEDVQWIDGDSLQVLKTLIADSSSENLLLVCTCRDLCPLLDDSVAASQGDAAMPTTEIVIGNIHLKDVAALVADVFHMEETNLLSEVVLKRTAGNMFHVGQLLDLLQLEGLLAPSEEGWTFNFHGIDEDVDIPENPAEILEMKIRRLEKGIHDVLKIASCLGHRFSYDLLVHICRSLSDEAWDYTKRRVKKALEATVHLGYLEHSKGQYRFVHDRIHQCWYKMATEGKDRKAMHLEIGKVVRLQMLIEQDNSLLFLAADNVCRGLKCLDSQNDVPQTVEMLLEAANVSTAQFAFVQASLYLHAAIILLRSDPRSWQKYYELCVDVFCSKVEIEKSLGHFVEARHLAEEVLTRSTYFDDSVKAYLLVIETLGCEGQLAKALKHGFKVLRFLGEKFPKSNILYHLVREIMATKKVLRRMSDDDLLSLPLMKDEKKLAAMEILSALTTYAYLSIKNVADGQLFCLLCLRMMRLTVKYGLCHESCTAFACHGLFEAVTGTFAEAIRYGQLAIQLVDQLGATEMGPRIDLVVQIHVMHCQQPSTKSREVLQRIYPTALELGDIDSAALIASGLIVTVALSEAPLSMVDSEIGGYCSLMKEYGQDAAYTMSLSSWQRAKNFRGDSQDVLKLTGAVMNEEKIVTDLKEDGNTVGLHALYLQKLEIALLFESWASVAALVGKLDLKAVDSHISQYCSYFIVASSYFALHRMTRRRKYRRGARRCSKKLREWADNGVPDCKPMITFLEAEMKFTRGDLNTPAAFTKASRQLSKSKSLPHFQAMAHERAGSYYLSQDNGPAAAEQYATALTKYFNWEGMAKVRTLKTFMETAPFYTDKTTEKCRRYLQERTESRSAQLVGLIAHQNLLISEIIAPLQNGNLPHLDYVPSDTAASIKAV